MAQRFNRIMLKVGGESLMGDRPYGIDPQAARQVAEKIQAIYRRHIQVAVEQYPYLVVVGAESLALWNSKEAPLEPLVIPPTPIAFPATMTPTPLPTATPCPQDGVTICPPTIP